MIRILRFFTPLILSFLAFSALLSIPLGAAQTVDPDIALGVSCLPDQTARFTLLNRGGDMMTAGSYAVVLTDGSSTATDFQLAADQSITFVQAGDTRVDVTYSTSTLSSVFLTATARCIPPTPVATTAATVTAPPTTPIATTAPTLTPTLGTPAATIAPTLTATLGTPAATTAPTLTATLGTPAATTAPTLAPTLGTPDAVTATPDLTATVTPTDTLLTLSVRCQNDLSAEFTISNEGSDMLTVGQYTLFAPDATEPVEFTLAAGESLNFTAPGFTRVDVIYSTQQLLAVFLSVQGTCLPIPDTIPTDPAQTAIPVTAEPAVNSWEPIINEAETCPDWLVYHTNMTGDWELFRLGDLTNDIKADTNLSRGLGAEIYDIMPATSPDGKWVAFTSNRDGNWEIYLSAVEIDWIRRITYDLSAIDLDPIWSPDGSQLVYESTRNGNWDLYLFDVGTGLETRLTTNEGDDTQPSWSHDATKIVFESDESGIAQIYELTMATLEIRQLSKGMTEDHEPQYSNDDQWILFRSNGENLNSVISTMSAEGGDVTALTGGFGDAINAALSPDNTLVAYQSDADGDTDIYVYEFSTGDIRKVTDNTLEDYAPMWRCDASVLVFTSEITGDSNLFQADALPMDAEPILVEEDALQLTMDVANDRYSESALSNENASRQQNFPLPEDVK